MKPLRGAVPTDMVIWFRAHAAASHCGVIDALGSIGLTGIAKLNKYLRIPRKHPYRIAMYTEEPPADGPA